MAIQTWSPGIIGRASGNLGHLRQRVPRQVRPAGLVQGSEGGENAPPQENAGVDAWIPATAIRALVSHKSSDVLFLQAPKVDRTQTRGEALGKLAIARRCGDSDGVPLSSSEVPNCAIEWQWLAGLVP